MDEPDADEKFATDRMGALNDLRPLIEPILEGHSHDDVITALASLLGQAIADTSDTRENATRIAESVGRSIASDIVSNWSLVRARRARG